MYNFDNFSVAMKMLMRGTQQYTCCVMAVAGNPRIFGITSRNCFAEHEEFVWKISSDILSCKKQCLEYYINYILSESQPLDEIALCCFAQMYHIHIEIIMDMMYWTTCQDHDLHKYHKLLGYIGGLSFTSIKWNTSVDSEPEPEHEPVKRKADYNFCPRKP